MAASSSYADTVRAVRQNSELNLAEMGAQVIGMRRTRDGHLFFELAKGVESVEPSQKLFSAIDTRLGEAVGAVSHLDVQNRKSVSDVMASGTGVVMALGQICPRIADDVGHEQKQCKADKDRCIAYERAVFGRMQIQEGSTQTRE
ncbi:hypothetical protein QTP88_028650 [Uroleucon formosanum]